MPDKKANVNAAARRPARKRAEAKEGESRFEALIRHATDMIIALDAQGLIQYASPSVERILGYKPRGALGKNFLAWVHPDDLPTAREAFASRRVRPGVAPAPLQVRGRHKDGSWRVIEALGTNLLDDPAVNAVILNVRDVTERVESERRLSIQQAVTLALSEADTLAEAMPKILSAVCEGLDWKRGECWSAHWSVDPQSMRLRCIESCQVSLNGLADFEASTSKVEFKPGEGLPGRVWQSGKPEWTPDVEKDGFARVTSATKAGIRAAFAFPVKVGNEVLGVMTFLDGEVRPPDEAQLRVMEAIGHQIGQFVERKRAEAALKANEERYRDLVENSHDLICTHDLQGRFLSVNRASAQAIGYQPEELIGRNLSDFLAPEMRPRFGRYLETIRKNGVASGVMKVRAKNGEDRLWEYRNTLRSEGLDEPIARGFAHDITQRVRAEQTLKKSEERFRALVEHATDEVSIIDIEGNLLYESPSANPTLGYKPGEFLGKSLLELVHPEDRQRFQRHIAQLIEDPRAHPRDQVRLKHRNGNWTWVEGVGTNLLADPAVRGIVVNYHDITSRKEAEQALAESGKRFRALIEHSADAIALLDRAGRMLSFHSSAAGEILGYAMQENEGRSIFELIHPDDRERVAAELAETASQPAAPVSTQLRARHKNGSWRWLEATAINLLDDPTVGAVVVNYRDITARKEAEEKNAQSLREITALRDIGLNLDADVSLEKVIRAALDGTRQATQADLAVFFRMGKNGLDFQGVSPAASPHHASAPVVPVGACLCGLAAHDKKPIYSLDIHNDLRCTFLECKTADIRSFASLPLIGEGEILGTLGIASHTERDFEKQSLFLEAIALTISISLRNALLYEKEKAHAAELEKEITERQQAEERFASAFNASPAGIVISAADEGRILDINPALLSTFGYTRAEVVGKRPREINFWASLTEREKVNAALERGGRVSNLEVQTRAKSGELRDVLVSIEPISLDNTRCLLSVFHDVTQVKRAEQEARLLQAIALGVSGAKDLDETVGNILRLVCEATGWAVGEAWVPSADGSQLERYSTWYSREPGMEEFRTASAAFRFAPGVGLPGRVWQTRKPVWVADVTQDANFPRAQLADAIGLKAGVGVPVLANDHLVLALEFFLREPRAEDTRLVELISAVAAELGVVVERKRAEEALRVSDERFRLALGNSPIVVFNQDLDLRYTWIYNPHPGFDADAVLGKTDADLLPADDAQPLTDIKRRALETGATARGEIRATINGEAFYYNLTVEPLRDRDNVVIGVACASVDITSLKRAEETIREAEAKYRALVENIPAVVYLDRADESSSSYYISPQIETLLGFTPEEYASDPALWHRQIEPRDYETALRSITETLERGRSDLEYRLIARDGRTVWVRDSSVLIRGADGIPQFIQGFLQDITARKQAEEAERDQRALAEALRDTAETLGGSLDYGEALDKILHIAGRVVPHDSATILLIENGDLVLARARGYADIESLERDVRQLNLREPGNLRVMFESRSPVIIPDVKSDPLWKPLPGTEWIRSSVGAPMIAQDKVIGFVVLDGRDPNMFASIHARRLQSFARQAAIAIHNARLYKRSREELAERKRAEEKLAASEAELRALFAAMQDVVITIDRDGVYRKIAPTNPALLYRPPDELLGKTLPEIFPPEQAETFQNAIRRVLDSREAGRIEYELQIGESPHWFSTVITPLDADNAVCVAHDITERKRAEETLKKLSGAVEQTADMVFITDTEGVIQYVNPAFEQTTGYAKEEALGNTPRILKSGLQNREYYAELWGAIKSGNVFRAEAVNRKKSGELYYVEQTITPIRDEHGKVTHFVSNCKDVTARKQAAESLLEAERFARSTFNALTSNIAVLDENGVIIAVNNAWLEFAAANGGGPQSTGVGMNYLEICDKASGEDALFGSEMAAYIRAALRGKRESREFEYPCHAPDEKRWYVARVTRFEAGGPARVVVSHGNITQQKLAETGLRRRVAELEAVSKIAAALRAAQTLDQMLPLLLDETLAALDSSAGSIRLLNPDTAEIYNAAARGWFENLRAASIKPGMGIVGDVVASGKTHISREFASDPLALPTSAPLVPPGWGGVCLPLRSANEVVGAIFVAVPLPRELAPEEIQLLTSISEIAGTAIHRLRLNEEIRRRFEQLQTLQAIDRAITSTHNLEIIMNILLARARESLGVDAIAALLLDASTQTLKYYAAQGFNSRVIEQTSLRVGSDPVSQATLERRIVRIQSVENKSREFGRADLLSAEQPVSYFAAPLIAKGRARGALEIFHRAPLSPGPEWFEFLATLAEQAAIAIDNTELFEDMQRNNIELSLAYDATIEEWSRAMELRDGEAEGHTRRIADLTLKLAQASGIAGEEMLHIKRGALLHDIGKMSIPDAILLKPGKLNDEEWELIRRHPQFARDMLSSIAYLDPALDIPFGHHEKWDGTGYPLGLRGEEIPLAARLFAVADVWGAVTSKRPYREAWPQDKALAYISEQSGKHFDPQIADLFLRMMERRKTP